MKNFTITFILLVVALLSCTKKYIHNPSIHNDGYYYVVQYLCHEEEHVTTINVDQVTERTIDLLEAAVQFDCGAPIKKFQIVHSWETDLKPEKAGNKI